MTTNGGNGSASPDKLMVLIGLASMAFGSYLTLQRDDTEDLQAKVHAQSEQIAVLRYQVGVLLNERERAGE